jgi:hypothetical protein
MTEDNLIHLSEYREQAAHEAATARDAQREADHSEKAATLLGDLRAKKRVHHDDQPLLAANLGQLVNALESKNPKALAKSILLPNQWEKRKRYIRLPSDPPNQSDRFAASGGTFAGIIDRLIEIKVRKGFDRTQAKIETVYGALKGTSSLSAPSRDKLNIGVIIQRGGVWQNHTATDLR